MNNKQNLYSCGTFFQQKLWAKIKDINREQINEEEEKYNILDI
jgi:hypothetical protein